MKDNYGPLFICKLAINYAKKYSSREVGVDQI